MVVQAVQLVRTVSLGLLVWLVDGAHDWLLFWELWSSRRCTP